MIKRRSIGITAVAVIAVGIIAYYCFSRGGSEKYTGPIEKITLAGYLGSEGLLPFIAEERGFFADNSLDVTIKEYEAGKLAADALLAGEADICSCADFVLVSHSFGNQDLRSLGTISMANSCELVARKDHGIETTADLRGKKLGVTRRSAGEFFLGTFLLFHDLSLQDVEIVDLKPSQIVEALANGEIDAGLSWQPNVHDMRSRLGQNAVSWPGQSGQDYFFVLVTQKEWLERNPSAAERLLRALIQAEEFVRSNDAEAQRFAQDRFQYESTYMESAWPCYRFTVVLPQTLIVVMEDQARWRIENKLTDATEVPNYLNYIHLDALEEAKPEAITIIRGGRR